MLDRNGLRPARYVITRRESAEAPDPSHEYAGCVIT
ncbi:MAG: hypothetical protein ACE1ZD_01775, partial [Dehalococcoidia bacterium]